MRLANPAFFGIFFLAIFFAIAFSSCNPNGDSVIDGNFYPSVTLSFGNSTVAVSSAQVISGNTVLIQISLKDSNGNPFVSTSPIVSLQSSGGTSTGIFGPVNNQGDGTYSSTFTGLVAGTPTTLVAQVDGSMLISSVPSVTVINVAPSSLTYSANPTVYTNGLPIANNTPANSGGPISSYSISPAPPAGLSFSTATGTISGTPTAVLGAQNYVVTGSNSGGSTTASISIAVLANTASAAQSTVVASAGSVTADGTTSSTVTVTLKDTNSNFVSGKTVTLTSSRGALDTVSAASGASTSSGVVTFTVKSTTSGNSTYTAVDLSDTVTITQTAAVTFTAGNPASITISSGNNLSATAGSPLPGNLMAVIKDTNGNTVSNVSVIWAVTAGGGSISACTTTSDSSGLVSCTFTTGTTAGSNTITATASGITTPATFTETGSRGLATQLAFTTQPASSGTTSSGFAPVVKIQDGNGNTVSASSSIALAAYTNSNCTGAAPGILSGTVSRNASAGVAAFSGITDTKAQTIYLQATSSGLTSACSNAIAIGAGTATQLVLTGPTSLSAGVCSTAYTASAEDQYGNVAMASGVTPVNLSGGGSGVFYSDACSTPATSVSIAAAASSQTFYLKDVTAQSLTLTSGGTGLTSGTLAVSVSAGSASKLAFTVQPSSTAAAGTAFATQPMVSVEDANGNLVSAPTAITLSAYTESTCTTASSTMLGGAATPVSASAGVASFSGVNFTQTGALYIKASGGGLTSGCSSLITISAGAAYQLGYATPPASSGPAGTVLSVQPVVKIQDQYGNNLSTGTNSIVLVAYTDAVCGTPATGTMSGTPISAVAGTATFTAAKFTGSVTLYFRASSGTLEAACSSVTVISPSAPTKLVMTGGAGILLASSCSSAYTITSEDINGNPSNLSSSKTINLSGGGSGTFYSNSTCTSAITSLSMPSGTNIQTFYFQDGSAETDLLNAADSASNLTTGTVSVSVMQVTQVSGGTDNTCAIIGGGVQCWGGGANGDLGNNAYNLSSIPLQVTGLTSGVTALSVGITYSACVAVNGAAKCWGNNSYGEIGNNSTTSTAVPAQVYGLTSGVTHISMGTQSACAVVSGAVWCWGTNASGQLGNNSTTTSLIPVQVSGIISGATAVSAGGSSACAIVSGAAECWGDNTYGELGNNSTTQSLVPVQVSGLTAGVTTITVGNGFACAIVSGAAKCWGSGGADDLGNNSSATSLVPVQVSGLTSGVTAISTDGQRPVACAVASGASKCWGANSWGQYGNNSLTSSGVPVQVSGQTSGVTAIAVGQYHVCSIINNGIQCWGQNQSGQLGIGASDLVSVPQPVQGLTSGVTGISQTLGSQQSCAIVNGGIKCWGLNNFGQLGNGSTTSPTAPVQVSGITSGATAVSIGGPTCAIVNGAAECWGVNTYGQLGNNSTSNSSVPVSVTGLTSGVTSLSSGAFQACAVVSGAAECWGYNNYGQLGNGSTGTSQIPVQVSGLSSGVTQVASGNYFGCALLSNGSVYCWGQNNAGQLGNNSTTNSTVPVQVQGLGAGTGVTAIALGGDYACALIINGTIQCWGDGGSYALGNGSNVSSSVPVQVQNITSGATALSAQSGEVCAVVSGGLRCWGAGGYGEIGNGTLSNSVLPAQVQGLTSGVTAVGVGANYTCAVVNGAAMCWGLDTYLQLGDSGSAYQSLIPVTVGPFQ